MSVIFQGNEQEVEDTRTVDVFVHSTSGSPDAWSEEDVGVLLQVWRDVVEQSPVKRFDIVRRVLKRLKEMDFKRLEKHEKKKAKDEIWRQMETLRLEYQVFKGLQKIKGLKAVRAPCVDHLEHILDRVPQSRRTTMESQVDQVSEDSDHSRRHSVSEGEAVRTGRQINQEEVGGKGQPRFQQRRMNLTRLVRMMVNQQQAMLEQLEKLFKVLEVSSERMANLAEASLPPRIKVDDARDKV